MRNRPVGASSAGFLLIGLVAGAAITWALNNGAKEKLTSGALGDLIPKDFLDKATKALREGTDKLIDAVDSATDQLRP
jgi:hypothetical protein